MSLELDDYQSLPGEKELEEVRAMPGLTLWKNQEISRLKRDLAMGLKDFGEEEKKESKPKAKGAKRKTAKK